MTDSQQIFTKNLAALRRHHPDLAAAIEPLDDTPGVQLRRTATQEWTLDTYTDAATASPYYPTESPIDYSLQLVRNLRFTNPRILVLLGLGLGYHLLQYADVPDPRNRLIVILEPYPHVFRAALQVNDFSALFASKQIHWILGTDLQTVRGFFTRLFSTWPWLAFANAIEFFPLPPAQALTPQFFQQVQKALPEEIGHQYNRHVSDPYDSFLGLDNTLVNLSRLTELPVIDQAQGRFAKRPGIVVASGPSLGHALPQLQQVGDRAIMVACPSALPLLLRENIAPHIWLNIERGVPQGELFASFAAHPPHLFVAPPLIHPRGWDANQGHNVVIRGAALLTNWLALPGSQLDLGHSSAHTAYQILELLGCDPIYLVGQDLAYHQSASHASGAWQESATAIREMTKDGRHFSVPGNSGKMVETNIFWWTFLKTFAEQLIPRFPGTVYNVIPEQYGAQIHGTIRIDPATLCDHLPPADGDLLTALKTALAAPSPAESATRRATWKRAVADTMEMLQATHQECLRFALHCKQILFHQDIGHMNWERTAPVWQDFVAAAEQFQMRFLALREGGQREHPYVTFFHPIIQGLQMRYLIEYYSHCTDLDGNFGEIQRKLEIMHHLAKDEAHWAMQCYQRLAHTLAAEL